MRPAAGVLGVVSAAKDHAAGWRLGQAKTGLTAGLSGEELRAIDHC